ncbi:alpha/beta hydrolase [Paenibacillus sp. OK003]|uniref:alpha/beta hydrolase n=1 Tax=Paenibacillus sp. OK003 TaxID=1884380 RepID=UPI0008BC71E0|nr:alpha/beta hydrolase [Paenibacillus sp. OK003]SEL56367.1 Acetyl esterase/lipase [Paenibacillus sp. OK003]
MEFTSRVLPELQQSLNTLETIRLPEELMQARAVQPPIVQQSENISVSDLHIPGWRGQPLRIRVYRPVHQGDRRLPALLWTHGGGYILGSAESDDGLCMEFVQTADCIVVSPDYRLAPEYPYPAAIEDCYAALRWMAESADESGMNINRIAVGGASAGGGLAAAVALMARDRNGPELCFQMPLYPMIDHRNVTPSSYEITHPAVWNRANNLAAWRMYLGQEQAGDVSPYASPSLADDLTRLPPAYICIGQLDPFRDETMDYAVRLAQAGVEVEFHLYPGCYHAFEHAAPDAAISRRARLEYVHAMSRALNR